MKQIHPNINPMVADSEELQSLWQRTVIAYNWNDLRLLEELEVLVGKALESVTDGKIEIEIPDIEEKISELEQEIQRIMETDPYQYSFCLATKRLLKRRNGRWRRN